MAKSCVGCGDSIQAGQYCGNCPASLRARGDYEYTGQELMEQIEALVKASGFKLRSYESNYSKDTLWIRNLEAERDAESQDKCTHPDGRADDHRRAISKL